MRERIIVSLTTWSKRIYNIPTVLDTIYAQTVQPEIVVLNLAFDEIIPGVIQEYLDYRGIEVNRVQDTKVYKKLIPTLKKYPNDCVISIDDDWLYPNNMISDFLDIHRKYPSFPVSGNREIYHGLQCHCGCASLTKASFFGDYLDLIDEEVIRNCLSDDIVYTYFSSLTGHPYIRSNGIYFTNLEPFSQTNSYSKTNQVNASIEESLQYLVRRFGKVSNPFSFYSGSQYMADLINSINEKKNNEAIILAKQIAEKQTADRFYASLSFRIGNVILKPFSFIWHSINKSYK